MALFKCKMCGGTLDVGEGKSVITCEYCGTQQTLPKLDDEKRANLYDRANHLRRNNEYDKAMAIYEQILNEDNSDAEAYWSIVLCRYGLEYVEDPSTGRRIPTVNRTQYTSIFADEDYKAAISHADSYQRSIYELEATEIDRIQKEILSISSKEEPFDVFICYKETDSQGRRTQDSVFAQELFYGLKNEGFNVFFSRITLEDKLGTAYEPYIFAALNSAKVMVVLGTKAEHFNAVWVKNEWSRFLSLMKMGEKKNLIPAYRDMNPYDLPEEFSHLQAQDMSKLGFMQDLIRNIKKIIGKDKNKVAAETVIINQSPVNRDTAPLLKRASLFLEDGEWDNANEYAEKVLDIDPECSEAYLIKMMIDLKIHSASQISIYPTPIASNPNYIKALRFAKGDNRNVIEGYNKAIVDRIELEKNIQIYSTACSLMKNHKYDEAISAFSKIKTFKDSAEQIEICLANKENDRKNVIYTEAMRNVASSSAEDKAIKKSIAMLQQIKGYRDVDEVIERFEARLAKWYEDKRVSEEKARIKAEQERLEAQRQAELRAIKAKETKKKAKKAAIIGVPSLIALAGIVVLVIMVIIPAIRLSVADSKFKAQQYDEALSIYSELDGFGDSEKCIAAIDAIEQIERGNIALSIRYLLSSGIPVEMTYACGGGNVELNSTNTTSYSAISTLSYSERDTNTTPAEDTSNTTIVYTEESSFSGFETPYRYGYTFRYWELGGYSYDVAKINPNFCIVLNAVWKENSYTISYYLKGGSVARNNPSIFTPEDESFTLINPTREGYSFAGWTGSDLSVPTMNVTISKGSYGNKSYTATWNPNQYTITFDTNGGTLSKITLTVTYSNYVSLPTPQKNGYVFMGWYLYNTKYESGAWRIAKDITLMAQWQAITYNINYVLNGGTNSNTNPVSYTVNNNDITLKEPTRLGYTFLGWTYTGQSIPKKEVTIKRGSTGERTFTAIWQVNTYTITFNAYGGSVSPATKTVAYGNTYTLPTPTRTGYTFAGWYNGTKQYTNGTWKDTSDITLMASWTANTYTITYDDTLEHKPYVVITFDYNYSGSTPTIKTLRNGQTLSYPTVPTRSGYAFAGWYTNSSCTTAYNFSGTITQDTTLYAKWMSMTSSYLSRDYVDIANFNSSSRQKSITVTASSESSQNYHYFTCYKSGTYTLNVSHDSGSFYITAYNVTRGSTIKSKSLMNIIYTSKSEEFTANAGDVIYVSFYNSSDSKGECSFYVSGVNYPTSTAKASCRTTPEFVYDTSSTFSATVTFGSAYTLPAVKRTGYSFLGWYNGETKVSSGNWNIASDVTLTPRWQAITNTITLNAYGGTNDIEDSISVTYDKPYTLPTPSRTGYTFAGWFSGEKQYKGGLWKDTDDVTLKASWTVNTYTITYDDTLEKKAYVVVTFDYNYSGSTPTTTTLRNGQTLSYPTVPTRSGYAFAGWYTNRSCTTAYNFNGTITQDTTLYAKWRSMTSNYYSREYMDIAQYSNSSREKSITITASSESSQNYYYFTCYKSGTYTLNASCSSGSFYITAYNETRGSTIQSKHKLYMFCTSVSEEFTANAGDVIYVSFYNSSESKGECSFYVSGANYPTSTAKVSCRTTPEFVYDTSSIVSTTITFGSAYTLPALTRTGYTFLGWYNGETKVESGNWNIASDVTLTPRWQAITNTLTLESNGGTSYGVC